MDNLTAVHEIYAAFGRGAVPAILDRLAPDVVFDPDFDGTAPWLIRREGRAGVAEFIADLDALPEDGMHLWTLGPDGLVPEMRRFVDTAKHAAAALVHH